MNNTNQKPLSGICCEVQNCMYNNGNCCCTANAIKVKNPSDLHGRETMCETYRKE